MDFYLAETKLLNFKHSSIAELVKSRGWNSLSEEEKILQIYNFVRDEIVFGFNAEPEAIPASQVLQDGCGHCNTKGILLMALLRAVGIPCRSHWFTIDRTVQRGFFEPLTYAITAKELLHSWVEVLYQGKWLNLEGYIVDRKLLTQIQQKFPTCEGSFQGYGVATDNFKNPPIEWTGGNTYIQNQAIVKNLGIFDSPDEFYQQHGINISGLKVLFYKWVLRQRLNGNVQRIRNQAQWVGSKTTISPAH